MAAADVVNHALVLLGDTETITDITDNVVVARAANTIYNKTRQAELRKHPWNFARKSVQIAKDATDPDVSSGYNYRYALPGDYMRLVKNDEDDSWQISESWIFTDDSGPLYFTYVADVTDTDSWDVLFFEAMAHRMALLLQPLRTKSNTKKQLSEKDYDRVIAAARKANAFEREPVKPKEDVWVSVRR